MANLILHKRMSIAQYNAFKTLHTVNGVVDDEFRNTLFVLNETGTFTGTDDCLFYMGEHLISYASYKKALALSASSTNDEFPTAKCVYDAIQALPHPMQYKGTLGTDGTITSLPSAASSNEGFTYKVITAGTYDSQEAKIGDVFISNGSAWTLIPSGDDIDDSWRNIKVNGTEELGSGVSTGAIDFDSSDDINATWTTIGNKIKFTHSNSVTAGTAGSSSDNTQIKTTGENITFQVPYVTYNSKGHVTSAGTHTETVLINLEDGLVRYDDEEEIGVMIPDDIFMVKDLSYYDVQGRLQNTRETANSYVISKTGYYKFPLVYGNAITGDTINSSAYTNEGGTYQADFVNYIGNQITSPYIEEDTGVDAVSASIEISDTNDIIDEIEIKSYPDEDCRFLRFRVKQVPSTGANAVISIRDGANNIMWSWHIWLWKESLEPVEIRNHEGNSYNILPVNLGSKYDSTGHLINWYYQWGRKDPMLLPKSYNSNTDHAYYGTTSFSIEPCAASVAESIKNPCTFYKSDSNYNNNWVQLNYYYNFWDATCKSVGDTEKVIVKTIYDPCPRDFTVPNARVFTGFTSTGDRTNIAEQFNVIGSFANGWYFKKNENDSVGAFFPASGYRGNSSGGLTNVGADGLYWSAGVRSSFQAGCLTFGSGYVAPLYYNDRAHAFSVRPVAI